MVICDFCGKDSGSVKKMIVNEDVAICSSCVFLCVEILMKEFKSDFKEIDIGNV